MKKTAFICLLLLSLRAGADVTVVEHVQAVMGDAGNPGNKSQDITFGIKGDEVRVDGADGKLSAIFDTGTGDTIALVNSMKRTIKAPGEMLKGLIAQAKGRNTAAQGGEAPKITDTGKQEKVGDYNAEIYTVETPYAKTTLWISNEVPGHAAIQATMAKFMDLLGKMGVPNLPDTSKIEGVAVKMETISIRGKVTISLVSAKEDPIPDANLQTPADYTEVTMADLQSGKGMQILQGLQQDTSTTAQPAPAPQPDSGGSSPAPSVPQLQLRQ